MIAAGSVSGLLQHGLISWRFILIGRKVCFYMKKSEVILATLCGFFFGVILGFLLSPIKKGIDIGNNSGNTTNNNFGDEDIEYVEEE